MENILGSRLLYKLLERIDADLAAKAKAGGCRHCGERRLHKGDYPRKPRGADTMVCWDKRHSFDCASCRRRTTPGSVRFLGRRVYVGVVVVVVSAMMYGATQARARRLSESLGIDRRTLERWREWWMEDFVGSGFWKVKRGSMMPVVDEVALPASLVSRFAAECCDGMVCLLCFLSPITVPGGLEGRVM